MKTLTNWSIAMDDRNPYQAPEHRRQCLHGQREKDIDQGTFCLTTAIVGKTADNKVITASGSEYTLLEVSAEYAAIYPDAFNRMMSTLPLKTT